MMSFLIVLVILLLLWVGIGMMLLYLQGRPVGGKEYQRSVENWIYSGSEKINVTVRLTLPSGQQRLENDQDILLILDHSTSMGAAPGSPLQEAVRAMRNFVRQLPPSCQVGLIIFDHEAQLLCHFGSHLDEIQNALKTVYPGGGTQLHLALDKGRETLAEGRPDVKKTVILLSDGGSDRKMADKSATELRNHPTKPRVICVGLGAYVDAALLKSVAGREDNYVQIETANHLLPLFELLAQVVGGETTLNGIVTERLAAPVPFRLEHTGEWTPLHVEILTTPTQEKYTQLSWFVSLSSQFSEGISLSYTLSPECNGWHSIAPAEAEVCWKNPDNSLLKRSSGVAGPKILVLPAALTWAFPVLNPLFWLTFGKLLKCRSGGSSEIANVTETVAETPSPIPLKPLTIPNYTMSSPALRPALVIGLGELGEAVVTQLKWQLWNHCVPENKVDLLVIQETSASNRPPVESHGCVLTESERVIFQQDFRPYLETLRQNKVPESRSWVPVNEWLADSRPLTTFEADRRKARLALLLQPDEIEHRLKASVTRLRPQEGIVFVVAHPEEASGSGMLTEIAHICATHEASVTAVLVSPGQSTPSPATVGMVRELERMLVMRGEPIMSDRGGQSVSATRLFDRVMVIQESSQKELNAEKVALSLWSMLAYPEILKTYLPPMNGESCYWLSLTGQILPQRGLWEWVRDKTLRDLINVQWLKVTVEGRQVNIPSASPQHLEKCVELFWQDSRLPELLRKSMALLRQNKNLWLMLGEVEDMPLERPYHEQQVFCDRQRHQCTDYLVTWCQQTLAAETVQNRSGLLLILAGVRQIEESLEKLIGEANKSTSNPMLGQKARLITSIYLDYRVIVSGLRLHLENWLARLVGWQPTLRINPLPQNFVPVCLDLEKQQEVSDRHLRVINKRILDKNLLEPLYQKWLDDYGQNLLNQLRFEVTSVNQRLEVELQFADQRLTSSESDQLATVLRNVLDKYQSVVWQWPTAEWVENFGEVSQLLRLGQFSQHAFPRVTQVVNTADPWVVSAFSVNSKSLTSAFHLLPDTRATIYAWPEEANALRLAEKMRNLLGVNLSFWTHPKIVSALREPQNFHGFLMDLIMGKVTLEGSRVKLEREGKSFEVGPRTEGISGIELFSEVVRQVVNLGQSLSGEFLPTTFSKYRGTPEEALRLLENQPLVKEASSSPKWGPWLEAIRAVMLEYRE